MSSLILAYHHRGNRTVLWLTLIACASYAAMLAAFFVLNRPVNVVVASSTTPPAEWMLYRMRWETGHAIAALLSVIGLAAVVRADIKRGPP